MDEKFCTQHSEVMRCLGALEENSEKNYRSLTSLHEKFDQLKTVIANGKLDNAVEKTKSSILYWVIASVTISAIAIIMSRFFVK